jgi:hypothetical protein
VDEFAYDDETIHCIDCSLQSLFRQHASNSNNSLAPFDVRDALFALTGKNTVQGFDEGKMACSLETLEEILNHLH